MKLFTNLSPSNYLAVAAPRLVGGARPGIGKVALHRNHKGLDLPIAGEPEQRVDAAPQPRRVALLGDDYVGMKPTMHVREGDSVRRGQLVFEDKKTPGVRYTSPAEGKVVAVNRGDKRRFLSLVVELSQAELGGGAGGEARFSSHTGRAVDGLGDDQVRELLLESGVWPELRSRPFGKVADPETRPHAIFVTATDSNPLAPRMAPIVQGREEDLRAGLLALTRLTDGPVYVCVSPDDPVPVPDHERIRVEQFAGPHPSGTVGWHIHTLDPVWREKSVWHAGVQGVIGIGHLFRTGSILVDRVVSLAGPAARNPRLLRTRLGAATLDVVRGEADPDSQPRVIAGSVLNGRKAGDDVVGFLGRYHQQISLLPESSEREFLGWLAPGFAKYSAGRSFLSRLRPGRKFAMTTSKNGSHRAIIPIGVFDNVFPFDIPAVTLLRSVAVEDLEACEQLGCLELEEEDLALMTYVDPGKNDFAPHLRSVLTTLEKEG